MGTIFGGALGLREAAISTLVVLGDAAQRIAILSINTPVGNFFVIESLQWKRYLVVLSGCGRPKSRYWWYWEMLLSEF